MVVAAWVWLCEGVPVKVAERDCVELAVRVALGVAVGLAVGVVLGLCVCDRVSVSVRLAV